MGWLVLVGAGWCWLVLAGAGGLVVIRMFVLKQKSTTRARDNAPEEVRPSPNSRRS